MLSSIQSEFLRDTSAVLFTVGGKIDLAKTDSEANETREPVTIRWGTGPTAIVSVRYLCPFTTQEPIGLGLLCDVWPRRIVSARRRLPQSEQHGRAKVVVRLLSRIQPRNREDCSYPSFLRRYRGVRAELYKLNIGYSSPISPTSLLII